MRACSFRIGAAGFVVIIVIFFLGVVFLFVFFLVWLVAKEDISGNRRIRSERVVAVLMDCAHAQMVRLVAWQAETRGSKTLIAIADAEDSTQ